MFNLIDLMWIEQRGMSIVTAIFFVGVFVSIASLFWWTRREVADIDAELAGHRLRLYDTQKEVSNLSGEIGKIRVSVENIETLTGKVLDHILK